MLLRVWNKSSYSPYQNKYNLHVYILQSTLPLKQKLISTHLRVCDRKAVDFHDIMLHVKHFILIKYLMFLW